MIFSLICQFIFFLLSLEYKLRSNEIKIFVQEPRVEFERILADAELMNRIAVVTGGKTVDHQIFSNILKELQSGSQVRSIKTVKSTKDAWDSTPKNHCPHIIIVFQTFYVLCKLAQPEQIKLMQY